MTLRCLSRLVLLGTLPALGLGFQPVAAHAAASASTTTYDYTLTTPTTIPVAAANISGPQDVATVSPNSSGVTPTLSEGSQGPILILNSSTGFNLADPLLVDGTKDTTSSTGQTTQQLGFIFEQAFQPSSALNVALTFNGTLTSAPQLTSITGPIVFTPDVTTTSSSGTTGASTSSSTSSSSNAVPEPLSVMLWSAMLVGVVARNRVLSRRKAA